MLDFEFFGFAPKVEFRRWFMRRKFNEYRRTVYEGIHGIESNTGATVKPTWREVFGEWARRIQPRDPHMARIYRAIEKRLGQGASLSQALQPYVPLEDYMVIDSGEATNKLASTFEVLLKNFEAGKKMREAVLTAYKTPLGELATFLLMSFYFGASLWPQMLAAMPEKYWPGWCLPMMHAQVMFAQDAFVILPLIGAVIWIFRSSLPRWTGARRAWCDRFVPMYSAYRDNTAAMLLIVLAGLLRAGKTIDQAMNYIGAKGGSRYLRWHTTLMVRRVSMFPGDPSRMLATGLINAEILDRIHNAAATRKLDETLQFIGSESIDSVLKAVKRSAEAGALVLYIVFSSFMMYSTAVIAIGGNSASQSMMAVMQAR
jgi:type II secretory pathway component PulF